MIKAIGLTKKYKNVTAVDKLNLEIKKGELFTLLGLNGAGKTTVIKMLSCLTKPTDGYAHIHGYNVTTDSKEIKKLIGVSPQDTAIAPNLTVKENLEFVCNINRFPKNKTTDKINELSLKLDLEDILKRKACKLSGGWQRRVSIAMALVNKPKILFLDEPTLGLDVIARHELWNIIKSLKGESTIILTTHYLEEVELLSDRVGVMKDGKLLAIGTVDELKNIFGSKSLEDAFISIVKEKSI